MTHNDTSSVAHSLLMHWRDQSLKARLQRYTHLAIDPRAFEVAYCHGYRDALSALKLHKHVDIILEE